MAQGELDLRDAVLAQLEGSVPGKVADVIRKINNDPELAAVKLGLLPAQVSLQQWINRRIGGEIEIFKDDVGRQCMRVRDLEGEVAADDLSTAEEFFETLPGDEFLPAEESLREALLAFLGGWRIPRAAKILEATADQAVKKHFDVLFAGTSATLGQWIQKRIGGEIDVQGDGPGQTLRAAGAATPEPTANAKRQRRV